MAYKYGNRDQLTFLPASIEEYVSLDDPVRAYDAFIDAVDIGTLGLSISPMHVENYSYDPVAMLKVLTYGYSYGWRSSRKLERALHHNLSFIWIAGDLKPDHKTIANFRKENKQVLKNVLKQCVRMCIKLDLIEGNILFADGSKFRANAGNRQTKRKEWLEQELSHVEERIDQLLEERIDQLLEECQTLDEQEQGSLVQMDKELGRKEKLREKINRLLDEIKEGGCINITNPDSKIMKGRQGSHASYNSQIVVDNTHGLIVSTEAVSDVVDKEQLPAQVLQAEANIGKPCDTISADAGFPVLMY